jgi:hypothetical protein
VLGESDSCGEVYPFSEEPPTQPHVVAGTRSELLVIARCHLIRACRKYPNIESGLIRLCRIRSGQKTDAGSNGIRKGLRFAIPTRMSLEILPVVKNEAPIIMKGYCLDLSVTGVSFIPECIGAGFPAGMAIEMEGIIRRRVRVTIPSEELCLAVSGQIVRKRIVLVKGIKLPSLGIQFAQMSPRLRGAIFAFAESANNAGPSKTNPS